MINSVQAQRVAARAEFDDLSLPSGVTEGELSARKPDKLLDFCTAVDLRIQYEQESRTADVIIDPVRRVNSVGDRGDPNTSSRDESPNANSHRPARRTS
jgi:hypothetical protein